MPEFFASFPRMRFPMVSFLKRVSLCRQGSSKQSNVPAAKYVCIYLPVTVVSTLEEVLMPEDELELLTINDASMQNKNVAQ